MKIYNELLKYKNRFLYQDKTMFTFTLDSIMVARFAKLKPKQKRIVDFGTNNAVIPLIISKYTKAEIVGVEVQTEAANLAQENVILNHLDPQIKIVNQDLRDFAKLNQHAFDAVLVNPPFFKNEGHPKLKKTGIAVHLARHEILVTLEEIIASAAKVLKNGGSLTMIHRAERLGEVIEQFYKHKIKPKRLQMVYSKASKDAKTILIEGIYQGNEGMQILPPLVAHQENNEYTPQLTNWFHD